MNEVENKEEASFEEPVSSLESSETIAIENEEKQSPEQLLELALAAEKDKYIRLYAEFENYKKRTSKERYDLIKTAGQETVVAMLPILDDFERALKQIKISTDVVALQEGIELVYNKFKTTLEQKGLKEMESKEQEFNPDLHEAITEIPAPTEELKGKNLDEVEKGYYLFDKIIRFAKVVVGK
jgi:molecular chaperone GrpE